MVTCDKKDATDRCVGRKKLWDIRMIVRLRQEMADEIEAVLQPKNGGKLEDRSDFVRLAIQREIDRRRSKVRGR
jgi:metal-responsive CopG/Arc/MetJ family transcriptional regulator